VPSRLLALALCSAILLGALPPAASADPAVSQRQARLAATRAEVARLDRRAELLTERYDRATWLLGVLGRRIRQTTQRLALEQRRLRAHERLLADLLVQNYKTPVPSDTDIVLGAGNLGEATVIIETRDRFDRSVSDAVAQVRGDRDAVRRHRLELQTSRSAARARRDGIRRTRGLIQEKLIRRRLLVSRLGQELVVAEAADRAGQAQLALEAQAWIRADRRTSRGDGPAQVRDAIALDALAQIGVPYRWGGASPSGFDCSGLIMWLYARQGISLPHFAAAQFQAGVQVPADQLEIGDLVFFHHLDHVGLYIGHGLVVHAPHMGDVVRIAVLDEGWLSATYAGATRVI
jgi:peptidoglycan DL-endopeptidase CwlO